MKPYLIIIGALPPPRGGVTTHVERLLPHLEEAGVEFEVWRKNGGKSAGGPEISVRKEPWRILSGLLARKPDAVKVVHWPISAVSLGKLIFMAALKMMGLRVTITFVASMEQTAGVSPHAKAYILRMARWAERVACPNRDFRLFLESRGVRKNKISVIPAYIPFKDGRYGDQRPIPDEAIEFCDRHTPLVLTYAYGPDIHQGVDLYGLDLILDMAEDLDHTFPRLGILVVIPEIDNPGRFTNIRDEINRRGLRSAIAFAIGNHFPFVPLLKRADLFVRATNTDGDALTLREAIEAGVPAVASDVCPRPEGTALFRNRDGEDMKRIVRRVLGGDGPTGGPNAAAPDGVSLFLDMFYKTANE